MKIISKIIAPYQDALPFSEGLAAVQIYQKGKGMKSALNQWGYMNHAGDLKISDRFYKADSFYNGLAACCTASHFYCAEKRKCVHIEHWGFIDQTGKKIIPFIFCSVGPFTKEGLAVAKLTPLAYSKEGFYKEEEIEKKQEDIGDQRLTERYYNAAVSESKWGYIDKLGNIIIDFIYDKALSFSFGKAAVVIGNKVGYIDVNGKVVNELVYNTGTSFIGEFAVVKDGHNSMSIIGTFTEKLNKKYSQIKTIKNIFGLFFAFENKSSKWGLIDTTGKGIKKRNNFIFDDSSEFYEGLAAVKINKHWGYINEKGEIILDCKFKKALPFSGNYALINNGTWCFINKKGELINDIKFDLSPTKISNQSLLEDFIIFKNNIDDVGFFKINGDQLLPTF